MPLLGTLVYIDRSANPPAVTLVTEGDPNSETTLSSSFNIPQSIAALYLFGTQSVITVDMQLSIGFLRAQTNNTILIKSGASLTIERLHENAKGTQCNFEVQSGATLTMADSEVLYVNSEKPLLSVSGVLNAGKVVVGSQGLFAAHDGSDIRIKSLFLDRSSIADISVNAQIGISSGNSFFLDSLRLGPMAVILLHTEEVTLKADVIEMMWRSRLNTTTLQKHIHIEAAELILHDEAIIDVSGGGLLAGLGAAADSTQGASYGGEGGNNHANVYGSPTEPTQYGSGNTRNDRGGGVIRILVTRRATIDGRLAADGDDGTNSDGGCSGGSIWISGPELGGHGVVSARGGTADGDGVGGGSGGRISVNVANLNNFYGYAEAYGGKGSEHGAAGTVYKQYSLFGQQRMDVIINNDDSDTEAKTAIIDPTDEMHLILLKRAVLQFVSSANAPLNFQKILGDRSGLIVVNPGQSVTLATSFGISEPYALPCKVFVSEGARVALPQKVLLTDNDGSDNDTLNLDLKGTLSNVRQLVVGSNARVNVTSVSNTITSGIASQPGSLTFTKLDVASHGILYAGVHEQEPVHILVHTELTVHFAGIIQGRNLSIETSKLSISTGGVIHADYAGYQAGAGPGRGQTRDDVGSGGSHGGSGGVSASDAEPVLRSVGGLHFAKQFGSGGGSDGVNGIGGAGGGIILIDCNGRLRLDGEISARGEEGYNTGGGGAGGALKIQAQDMLGSGTLDATGK